jgi:endonuclease III
MKRVTRSIKWVLQFLISAIPSMATSDSKACQYLLFLMGNQVAIFTTTQDNGLLGMTVLQTMINTVSLMQQKNQRSIIETSIT